MSLTAKVIIGLGNPGRRYERTRHNTGFWVLDSLAHHWNFPLFKDQESFLLSSGQWEGLNVHLVKPCTYMNSSGLALIDFQKERTLNIDDLLVIYDDIDLPLGTIRIRASGSSGGHKGVDSIILALESKPFARLRVGIGPDKLEIDATSFVLSEFSEEEEEKLLDEFPRIIQAIECFCLKGVKEAMNLFN
ncbi:MAG: aminoacyl-tRNA hydrolase [Candidatus Glassbacteria bacterium]